MKRIGNITFVIALMLVLMLGGCSQSATVPSKPSPVVEPTVSSPQPTIIDPMAGIIAGAKKEGQVSALLTTGIFTPDELVKALQDSIKKKYGVDLKITWSPPRGMSQQVATAISEYKTGIAPTFDLMLLSTSYIPEGMRAGAFERVDWKPLIEKGTPIEVIHQNAELRGSIIVETNTNTLLYNPSKIPAAEVPKTLADLANPKWKGRLGLMNYPADWSKWAFILGKDKTLASLRSIMNNKPLVGQAPDVNNRYLIGEIDMAVNAGTYYLANQAKGVPTILQDLDFVDIKEYEVVIRTGAQHPNAAKLLAIYLAGPDGAKFLLDFLGRGTHYYPGNYVFDAVTQAKKAGIKAYTTETYPGLLEFILSPQAEETMKQIELILKGA